MKNNYTNNTNNTNKCKKEAVFLVRTRNDLRPNGQKLNTGEQISKISKMTERRLLSINGGRKTWGVFMC